MTPARPEDAMSEQMRMESPWTSHLRIAIKVWARERARQLSEKALKVPARNQDMEYFLTELLTDALLTFNETYNAAYDEQIHRLERMLEEKQNFSLPQPILMRIPHE
jgi:hypothetical protein